MSILDIIVLLTTGVGIVFLFVSDDKTSINEYIRRHPEEFRR